MVLAQQTGLWKCHSPSGFSEFGCCHGMPLEFCAKTPLLINRKVRMGRNPANGEAIQIKAKKVGKFRVTDLLLADRMHGDLILTEQF